MLRPTGLWLPGIICRSPESRRFGVNEDYGVCMFESEEFIDQDQDQDQYARLFRDLLYFE